MSLSTFQHCELKRKKNIITSCGLDASLFGLEGGVSLVNCLGNWR